MGDPVRERADSGIERIEKHQAAHARARAASIEDSQRRAEASAVGDNDNWHGPERPRSAWIAVHLGELLCGFVEEALKSVGLPELSGARIARIEGKLRRYQDRIGSRRRDLCRQALPIAHIARQVGAVAMKKNYHDGRTIG